MRYILSILLLLFVASAWADGSIQDLIVQDCPSAFNHLQNLSVENRRALVPALEQIAKTNLSLPVSTNSSHYLLPMPGKEIEVGALWRNVSPEHHTKAQNCAVRLLGELGSEAGQALKQLLELGHSESSSAELRDLADTSVMKIALALGTQAQPDFIKDLLPTVQATLPFQGHNVVGPFPNDLTLPQIIQMALKGDELVVSLLAKLLQWLDPTGQQTQPMALKLLSDTENCEPILTILSLQICPSKEMVEAILNKIIEESSCRAQIFHLTSVVAEHLQNPNQICLANSNLASAPDLFARLNKLAKEQLEKPDHLPLFAIVAAITKLMPGRNISLLNELINSTLELECRDCIFQHPTIELLKAAGRQSAEIIFKGLQSGLPAARGKLSQALVALDSSEYRVVEPCTRFIADTDILVQRACYKALQPYSQAAESEIRRTARKKVLGKDRNYAALLILNSSPQDQLAKEIIKPAISAWPCGTIGDLRPLSSLQDLQSELETRIIQCLSEKANLADSLDLVESNSQISPQIAKTLEELVPSISSDPVLLVRVIKIIGSSNDNAYLNVLMELALTTHSMQCEALSIYWRLTPDKHSREDLLSDNIDRLTSCLGTVELSDLATILPALAERSPPRDKDKWIRAVGFAAQRLPELQGILSYHLTSDLLAVRYEAIVGLLRSKGQVKELAPLLLEVSQSRFNWLLASEPLPQATVSDLRDLFSNDMNLLSRKTAILLSQKKF